MAAYSALGLGNRVWVVRADVDLDQLVGTSIRPIGMPANNTVWLDTSTTTFGIFEYNRDTLEFTENTPIIITSATDCISGTTTPKTSIGSIGQYAVTVFNNNNYIYHKNDSNMWDQLGSSAWSDDYAVITSDTSSVNIPAGSAFALNDGGNGATIMVESDITGMSDLVDLINNDAVANVHITASTSTSGRLALFVDTDATDGDGTGVITLSAVNIVDVDAGDFIVGRQYRIASAGNTIWADVGASAGTTGTLFTATDNGDNTTTGTATPVVENDLTSIGIPNRTFGRAIIHYGSFADVPAWSLYDDITRPSHSVWIKTSSQGDGANFTIKRYSESSAAWKSIAAPVYPNLYQALYSLDITSGGSAIAAGTEFVKCDSLNNGLGSFTIYTLLTKGQVKVTGDVAPSGTAFNVDDEFSMVVSVPGTDVPVSYTCTLAGRSASDFVAAILAQNIPNVTATVEQSGHISISHRSGGVISLINGSNPSSRNPITVAGFTSNTVGIVPNIVSSTLNLTNWRAETYTYSNTEPSTAPASGTYWYYDDATEVDIMINDATGWRGYKGVSRDSRGYDLTATDPNGVIVSPTKPTTQSGASGASLAPGDLWLDSGDLENYPRIYRYNSSGKWVLIDNTDRTSQNGIIFADARWDTDGESDTVTGSLVSTSTLLTSNYTDLDAPNFRLYPRGALLFNTRRSGFGVKKFVADYFNTQSFNVTEGDLPTVKSTWVSEIGLNEDGSPKLGHKAQRNVVVEALKSAIDGSTDLREEAYAFNLLACPGYPELIVNMVQLNNDRVNTGFVIGDTPLTLPATMTDITAYDAAQTVADSYLGIFYPSALSSDLAGNEICVPASHMMLRTFLHSDNLSYQWFAPAGTRRGLVDNATAIGYLDATSGLFVRSGISQQLRDTLYEKRLNPITLLQGAGIVVYGQKTRAPSVGGAGSSMDRINVARLVNYLRTVLRGVANGFLFEPNDKITRDQVKQLVEGVLNDLIAKRGLYDYLVVCDTSNNTSDRIARNELYVDIAIEPMKDVEFIYIPLRLKNPGTISGLK